MRAHTGPLFTLPIGVNGNVVCTQPAHKIYLIEFTSPPDNRLLTVFCEALLTALDIIEAKYERGVVITTSGIQKFYSNGLDLEHASRTPGFYANTLYKLWRRLLIYPMPTVALVNGHAFAGALMLAMHHDYRIMNPHRGFLCLNEVDLGVPLRAAMSSIFREKCSPQTYRSLVLEGKRFKALEALKEGIVDGVGDLQTVLKMVTELDLVKKSEKGVVGLLKAEMYRESLAYLESFGEDNAASIDRGIALAKENQETMGRVKVWEGQTKEKAKL